MQHRIIINDLAHIDEAADEFLKAIGSRKLVAFYAPMGAGKTTFTTALCNRLGVERDAVSSPTFAIVNEYRTASDESIFHFDFYRIRNNAEALDIGLYEYLDSGCLCLMEWAENISELLPEETMSANISVGEDGTRILSWSD